MGGREPLSLLSWRGCFLMWHASSESLVCKFSCWSWMVTSLQSTLWPAFHACSANADELMSAILAALLCSSTLLHSVLLVPASSWSQLPLTQRPLGPRFLLVTAPSHSAPSWSPLPLGHSSLSLSALLVSVIYTVVVVCVVHA